MADWRAERKGQRKSELEKKILSLRTEAEEKDRLISAVESEGVVVDTAEDAAVCCYGTPVDTKSLLVSTSNETFEVEAGCKGERTAVITFATLSGDKPKITMDKDGKVELVNIIFGDVKEALGVLRAATVLLKAQSRRKE